MAVSAKLKVSWQVLIHKGGRTNIAEGDTHSQI
jgi:hypothetical protein